MDRSLRFLNGSIFTCYEHVTEPLQQSLAFTIQPSQHNTFRHEWNEHGEPWLHHIKWYRVDQCAQALLTSKVLGYPPLGYCFASFTVLGSNTSSCLMHQFLGTVEQYHWSSLLIM